MMNETAHTQATMETPRDLAVRTLQDASQRTAEQIAERVSQGAADTSSRMARACAAADAFRARIRPGFTGLYAPRTWAFWRTLITCFCIGCIVGHWMEIPYCSVMNLFGIVDSSYAVWSDPWYHPYWVYGFGFLGIILGIEPLRERIIAHRKTLWGAFLETWAIAIFLSMVMELVFGWIVNQPDAFGVYPYWDNSQLPGNIFGQAWIVNDVFIGLAGMLAIWVIFPLVSAAFRKLALKGARAANIGFALAVAAFIACCLISYAQLGYFSGLL